MSWAMQDEAVKVQMFRFVDVLPMLADSDSVTRHLHEYFHDVRTAPADGRALGPGRGDARSLAGRALAIAARRNATGQARRFIAGTNTGEVLAAAMRERKLRRAFTLDHLGRGRDQRSAKPSITCKPTSNLIAGIAPTVNAWPEVPQIDRDGAGRTAARECLDQALGARQPVRSRSTPKARRARWPRGCGRCCARPGNSGRSSTSTWNRTSLKDLTLAIFQQICWRTSFAI